MRIEQIDFYGLKISNFSIDELHEYYDHIILNSKTIICYGYSFGIIPLFKKYGDLYRQINSFDVNVIDGTQFFWFISFFGIKLKTFLSIPYLTIDALKYAHKHKKSVMLLGADDETNMIATSSLKLKYPDIIFYDGYNGYFKDEEVNTVLAHINRCKPDFLFIGISTPIKEQFAYNYKNQLAARIIVPCGGMIDVFAGKVKMASPFLKKIGLATLIRIIQEPRRQLNLNLWLAYETLWKIIPRTLWEVKIKKNTSFFLPSIYKIKR